MKILQSLRPHQWIKNLILFVPIIFSGNLFMGSTFLTVVKAVIVFCLAAGGIYVVNDVMDVSSDKKDPVKARRPLAAGQVTLLQSQLTAASVLTVALIFAFLLQREFFVVVLIYILLMLSYSFWLKREPVLDILIVAMGFVLRAVAGAVVIGVSFSSWLLVTTLFLASLVVLLKRRQTPLGVVNYSGPFVDGLIWISASGSVIAYSLYTLTSEVSLGHGAKLVYTLPIVIYAIFRYLFLVYLNDQGEDPAKLLLSDPRLQIALFVWLVMVVQIIY